MIADILKTSVAASVLVSSVALAGDTAPVIRDVPVGGMIAATIDGKPVTLRVDPAAPGLVFVTSEVAERLALKGGALGLGYSVGGQGAMQATTVRPMTFGTNAVKRRIGFPSRKHETKGKTADPRWVGRPYADVGDGSIGPASLPEPVVRILLNAPRASERHSHSRGPYANRSSQGLDQSNMTAQPPSTKP